MVRARRRPEKTEFFTKTENVSREKSIATWKAMPNVGLYMVEASAQTTEIKNTPQITFSDLLILDGSFSSATVLKPSSRSSFTLFWGNAIVEESS